MYGFPQIFSAWLRLVGAGEHFYDYVIVLYMVYRHEDMTPGLCVYSKNSENQTFENEVLDIFLTGDYEMQHASIAECSHRSVLQFGSVLQC